jgi:putative modified peptide
MSDEVQIRISPQQAKDLLKKLADDEDFRARIARNPVDELSQFGISVPPALVPAPIELPSREEISQLQAAIDGDSSAHLSPETGPLIKFGPLVPALMWLQKVPPASGS